MAGGSITKVVGGGGALVLAILGLVGTWPGYMAAIATIACGAAVLAQGSSTAARNRQLATDLSSFEWGPRSRVESGMEADLVGAGIGTELLGGVAAVVLGILSLTGLVAASLVPIAVIVLGGSLLLGGNVGDFGSWDASGRSRTRRSLAAGCSCHVGHPRAGGSRRRRARNPGGGGDRTIGHQPRRPAGHWGGGLLMGATGTTRALRFLGR